MIFNVTLGIAYFNQGFINIKESYNEYFGQNNSIITVYLGSWNEVPIEARIDRTAQPTSTPRIMMGTFYTTWVQQNHRQGDDLIIDTYKDRKTGWRAIFGQSAAAQGHLNKQGVGIGDIFLFFGSFAKTKIINEKYTYIKNPTHPKTKGFDPSRIFNN